MKKAYLLMSMLALTFLLAGCTKNNGNRPNGNENNQENQGNNNNEENPGGNEENPGGNEQEPQKAAAKTGVEDLILWVSFDDEAKPIDVADEAITWDGHKAKAAFGSGFIGKAWTNQGGANTEAAYTKLNLAAGNALTKMESFTFSVWAKLPADKEAKSGIISFNGTGAEPAWPSFVFLFDNISDVDLEDGTKIKAQQFNGRIDFLTLEGKPILWPNCASEVFNLKNDWFQLVRTYDAATGHWANYGNGQLINAGDFLGEGNPAGPVKAAFAADCNALYIGGWASRIEGKATDAWQAYCPGSLDELRFYNKAFTEEEVLALYKEELAISLEAED